MEAVSPRHSVADLAARTGLTVADIRQYWKWIGLPAGGDDDLAYTDDDLAALLELRRLVRDADLDDIAIESLVRSLGYTSERLAFWQMEALIDGASRTHRIADGAARRLVLSRLPGWSELLVRQLEYAARRQLAVVEERYAAEFAAAEALAPRDDDLPFQRTIGFADLVGFTARTARLGNVELGEFIRSFETRARDAVIDAGGRVVKTVGDAVLFLAEDVRHGAEVALALAEQSTIQPDGVTVGPLRVGLASGRVLARFGDVFGPTVNLAARLCEIAAGGQVLTDPGTATALAGRHPGQGAGRPEPAGRYVTVALAPVHLPGIGQVTPVSLRRDP